MGKLAPVVLFVYNREDKTKNIIESLKKCFLAEQSELFIFADAPKQHRRKDREQVDAVWNYLDTLKSENKSFKKLEIYKAQEHKGLSQSVIDGVSAIIKMYKKVIVLEDDLLLSNNFLVYMNQALDYYRHNKKIWSVTGYTMSLENENNLEQDVYYAYRGCSWGWGTWINRWKVIDWDVRDYPSFRRNIYKQWKLNRGGNDLSKMLCDQRNGKNDSWAVRWCYEASKRDLLTVYPKKSMVWNDGIDGSGTHCGKCDIKQMELMNNINEFRFGEVYFEKKIIKDFKEYYKVTTKQWLKNYISGIFRNI